MKAKRVIWVCNHTTLMEFECNLLLDLGYEVYTPKKLPCGSGIDARTANIDFQYDKSLSIPQKDINCLNQFNFYNDVPTKRIKHIINTYFDVCFFVTIYPGITNFAQFFKGKLFVRVFGHEKNMNYELATHYTECSIPIYNSFTKLQYKIQKKYKCFRSREITEFTKPMFLFNKIKDRITLAAAYDNIATNENKFFKNRNVYLPIGLPNSILKHQGTWKPTNNKIIFVCPSIHHEYYKRLYQAFVKTFGSLEYAIFGKQNGKYEDPDILGYLSREQYNEALKNYKCMFYHSQEPRHLHYHPLEAIAFGMPLIFLSGGLLEHISKSIGHPHQPGMAKDYQEAYQKIKRIINGDKDFMESCIENQKFILEAISYDNIKKIWMKNFS